MRVNNKSTPIARLKNATLRFGAHQLWHDVSLTIEPGEFVAVLGPNGAGKSSLLKVLLGLQPLSSGQVQVVDRQRIGYVPQQKAFDPSLSLRGRDLVQLGIDGARWGLFGASDRSRQHIGALLKKVGASSYADRPIGLLSGGEQQRLRIAQALASEPKLLLCDEPLLSLDMASQQTVSELIDGERKKGAAVVFVTHEINPIFPLVDRVLYMVEGRWAIGAPDEILTSERLTDLYQTHIDVLRIHGRIVVVNVGEPLPTEPGRTHHHRQEEA